MSAPTTEGFAPVIQDVYRLAYSAGAGGACRQLLDLRDSLRQPARIPVVGERSRGKSSLINALLRRRDLLPVDVDVSSNVFVVLAAPDGGSDEDVEVSFSDGRKGLRVPLDQLVEYASELGNPDNERGVRSVVVRVRGPLLERGVQLIDTPGVGGLVSEHGSMAFEAVRGADGLVMVLEAAKPVSRPEIDFIELLSGEAGGNRVVFCLTKADLYQGGDLAEMTGFLDDALRGHAPALAGSPAVCVSTERLWRALRETGPDDRRRLAEQSGMPALLRAVSTHLLGGLESDRVATVLGECRRITDDLARPHRERLEVLRAEGDPQARLRQLRAQVAALPDSRKLHSEVHARVTQLWKKADRDLRTQLQAMNHDLEDRIKFQWSRSMRRSLPTEYDDRYRLIWSRVLNNFNAAVAGLARESADALGVTVPKAVEASEIRRDGRWGKRIRGWARIAWMSVVSLGLMFPVQYMEHRETMRSADREDARHWLRRCVQLQGKSFETLRDHATAATAKVVATLEPPVADRRRSLGAAVAALEDLDNGVGPEETEQTLRDIEQLAARVDALLDEGDEGEQL